MLGLTGGFVRPPLVALRTEELQEVRALVPQWQKAAAV